MGQCQDVDIPRFVECLGSFQYLDATAQMAEMGSEVPCPISRHHENCCRDCAPIVVLAAASATGEM